VHQLKNSQVIKTNDGNQQLQVCAPSDNNLLQRKAQKDSQHLGVQAHATF
jgi:hypothetical protein